MIGLCLRNKYKITIKETLAKTIEIEADSLKEAEYAATKLYHNCDIVLSADDYDTTEIFAL